MMELSSPEVVCPVCKKSFFPHTRAGKRVLCGIRKTPSTGKNYDPSECSLYYFCSEECVEHFDQNQPSEPQTSSKIKKFLERVGDASARCGIDEDDVCHIIERITGRTINKGS